MSTIDSPVACPFCGNALVEGRFHSCREMREAGYTKATSLRFEGPALPRLSNRLVAILAIVVLAYLGAHLLVSMGVGCPTS